MKLEVVDNLSYVEDGNAYEIRLNIETLRLDYGQTGVSQSVKCRCWGKEGTNAAVAQSCYWAVYLRNGTTYTYKTRNTTFSNAERTLTVSGISTAYQAIAVYALSTSPGTDNTAPTSYIAKAEIPIVVNGQAAVRIDLNNEADMIACDSNGKVRFARTITTVAKIYDGASVATSVTSVSSVTLNVTRGGSTVNVASNGSYSSGVTFTFTFQEGDTLADTAYPLTISIVYNGQTYTSTFTLTRMDAAAIYQLYPSLSEMPFALDASTNDWTPASYVITCGYKKITGSGVEVYPGTNYSNTATSGSNGNPVAGMTYNAPYNIFYRYDATGNWSWLRNASVSSQYARIEVSKDTTHSSIEFCLSSAASYTDVADANIIDRETVPIIKSGKKGDSAVIYELESEPTQLKSNASRTQTNSAVVKAYRTVGNGTRSQYTLGTITATPYDLAGTALVALTGSTSVTISTRTQVGASSYAQVSKWEITLTVDGSIVARLTVPIITDGPTLRGPRKWVKQDNYAYQCGASGEAFLDLVIYDKKYYQCIQSYTESYGDSHRPDNSSDYWRQATQFDFVATDLLLAERAKIVNLVVEELEARKLISTSGNTENGWYTRVSGGEFEIGTYTEDGTDDTRTPRYRLGFQDKLVNGVTKRLPVIQFLDETGTTVVGQIDETLFNDVSTMLDSWAEVELVRYTGSGNPSGMNDERFNTYSQMTGSKFYIYSEGYTMTNLVKQYSIGKWTSGSSYDKTQHSLLDGKYLTTMSINSDTYKKGAYTDPVNGYYIDPTKFRQVKKNSDGVASMERWCMDVYQSTSEGSSTATPPANGTFRGKMVKVGVLATAWVPSGLTPEPSIT